MSNEDIGWDYLNSDDSDSIPKNDGDWIYESPDGGNTYHGEDGSWGYKNSDGSGSYYGADGSWGYKNSDGSGSYYGNDGSWGYTNSDGTGSFYDSDGNYSSYESSYNDEDDDENEEKSWGEIIGETLGAAASTIIIAAMEESHRQREIEREAEHKRELELRKIEAKKEREALKQEEIRRKERQEWRQQHKGAIVTTIFLVLAIALFSFGYYQYQKLIPIGYSESDLIGLNYGEVVQILREKGFENISTKEISNLSLSEEDQSFLVTNITLEILDDFNANTKYLCYMPITIEYHTLKLYSAPITSKDAKRMNYNDIVSQFIGAGFVNIKTDVKYDLITGWITDDGAVESITINGSEDFDCYNEFRPDAEVIITYHALKKNKPK